MEDRPRYIGFRVKEYIPDVISLEVSCALIGLIVVLFFLNRRIDTKIIIIPSNPIKIPSIVCPLNSNDGIKRVERYNKNILAAAINGGGILFIHSQLYCQNVVIWTFETPLRFGQHNQTKT